MYYMGKLTGSVDKRGICQVCSAYTSPGNLNCDLHLHVRQKTVLLAQDIFAHDDNMTTAEIKELATKHGVHEQTVKNHLKRAGYRSLKEWRRG